MKIAVTGATGFTGGHTLAALARVEHTARALVRSPEKLAEVEQLHQLDSTDHVVGDVTDPGAVTAMLDGCDAVIHAAAVAATRPSMNQTMRDTNEPATRLVLEAAAAAELDPIVHVSSVSAIHPPPSGRYGDDDPLSTAPAGVYAETKVACERVARRLQRHGAPVVIVWPSGIYGPDDVGLSVAAEGTAKLLSAGVLPLPSTGGNLMHDVRDLAEVLTRCMTPGLGPRRYGVFGHYLPWDEMATVIADVTGASLRTPSVPAWFFTGLGRFGDLLAKVRVPFPVDGAVAGFMTTTVAGDDARTRHELAIDWRPAEDTFADMLRWLIAAGHLDPGKAPALAQ